MEAIDRQRRIEDHLDEILPYIEEITEDYEDKIQLGFAIIVYYLGFLGVRDVFEACTEIQERCDQYMNERNKSLEKLN